MKERPILFSGPMVRAILEGRKTQTRRVVKPQPEDGAGLGFLIPQPNASGSCAHFHHVDERGIHSKELTVDCPYGMPGHRLWVRENFSGPHYQSRTKPSLWSDDDPIWYWADGNPESGDWTVPKPSIHMPRWASRITLEITSVRVERLQDISYADCGKEGAPFRYSGFAPEDAPDWRGWYRDLWEQINGAGSWQANPFVWVVEFRQLSTPVSLTGKSSPESFVTEGGAA